MVPWNFSNFLKIFLSRISCTNRKIMFSIKKRKIWLFLASLKSTETKHFKMKNPVLRKVHFRACLVFTYIAFLDFLKFFENFLELFEFRVIWKFNLCWKTEIRQTVLIQTLMFISTVEHGIQNSNEGQAFIRNEISHLNSLFWREFEFLRCLSAEINKNISRAGK